MIFMHHRKEKKKNTQTSVPFECIARLEPTCAVTDVDEEEFEDEDPAAAAAAVVHDDAEEVVLLVLLVLLVEEEAAAVDASSLRL
jgi:hypothetical protein